MITNIYTQRKRVTHVFLGQNNYIQCYLYFIIIWKEFEDLDEIIARFIQPMAAFARDLISHKNYREVGGKKELLEDFLKQAKKATPSRIPYFMTASKTLPGRYNKF